MIKGKTVSLRPIEERDQEFIHQLNADPGVRANVVGWDFPQSLHQQRRWFENSQTGSTHRWIVEDSEYRQIGLTGLWDVDHHNRNALTALKLGGPYEVRGRGFGPDAIKAVMAFAFYDVGLERLYSSILDGNRPSLKAYCEHCNWSVEGTSRRHVWRHGRYVDLLQIGALKGDFDAIEDSVDYINLVTRGRV